MASNDEKNNPPLWFIIVGIIVVSIAAIFVMLAPTKKYTPQNVYWLNGAQGSVINKTINCTNYHYNLKLPGGFID